MHIKQPPGAVPRFRGAGRFDPREDGVKKSRVNGIVRVLDCFLGPLVFLAMTTVGYKLLAFNCPDGD